MPRPRRDISAAYYSLMVVCVELQKLGNGDGAANATAANAPLASHKTFTSGFLPINWRRLMIFSGWQAHTKFKEKKRVAFLTSSSAWMA